MAPRQCDAKTHLRAPESSRMAIPRIRADDYADGSTRSSPTKGEWSFSSAGTTSTTRSLPVARQIVSPDQDRVVGLACVAALDFRRRCSGTSPTHGVAVDSREYV